MIDEDAERERRRIPRGRKALAAQREAYFALDGEITQVWARAKGSGLLRWKGERWKRGFCDAVRFNRLVGEGAPFAFRSVAESGLFDREGCRREDVAAWEATPNREAQPSSLKAPSDAVDADLSVRTADRVGSAGRQKPAASHNAGQSCVGGARGASRPPT